MRGGAILLTGLVATGVGGAVGAKPARDVRATEWRQVATDRDRERIRNWRETWRAAVASAQAADRAGVAAAGQLLAPDRALDQPIPPAGSYRCRTVKLGTKNPTVRGFISYPWFECRVEDDDGLVKFTRTTGSQRPVGRIYKDGDGRGIFLGTLMLGEESGVLKYGRDLNRDMAGLVQRIGPNRWRIAFPAPTFESQLDVMEVVPAG